MPTVACADQCPDKCTAHAETLAASILPRIPVAPSLLRPLATRQLLSFQYILLKTFPQPGWFRIHLCTRAPSALSLLWHRKLSQPVTLRPILTHFEIVGSPWPGISAFPPAFSHP